jgi:hypothetical protein
LPQTPLREKTGHVFFSLNIISTIQKHIFACFDLTNRFSSPMW